MIFQAETKECGLACLAMIASFYGRGTDLNNLRGERGSTGLATSAKQLLALAEKQNLQGRALKVGLEDLSNLTMPVILHWDLDHYVVLKKLGARSAIIHDPAVGVRKYQSEELACHFTGIVLEFKPRAEFVRAPDESALPLSQLLSGVQLSLGSVGLVFLMTLLLQVLAILNPLYLQLVIDQGLVKGDTELIMMLALLFVGLVVLKAALGQLRGVHLLYFGNQVGLQLVSSVARHLVQLPLGYFERRDMGDIVSRFGSLENVRRLITQEMITVVVDGLFSLIALFLLYLYSPLLATTVLVAVLLFTFARLVLLTRERALRHEVLITSARQQTRFMENVRSISVARIHAIESARHNDWERSYTEQLNSGMRLESFQLCLGTTQTLLFGLENIITIYLGALAVNSGSLSLGQLMSFIFLKQHFTRSVLALIPKLSEIHMLGLDLERIADVVQQEPETTHSSYRLLPGPTGSDVELQDIAFSYSAEDQNLLQGISHKFMQGQLTAITGPSGCGKSTLLKLILGLETPVQGTVLVGNRNIRQINHRDLRGMMSAVMHGDDLLSGDLSYNIHLGTQSVDWDRIDELSGALGLEELVVNLPLGYSTEVGELGCVLSAGQVQRILLSRALYRQPKILLLDETLSNLNTSAAMQILEYLVSKEITVLLVTHNPELIANVDAVLNLG